ncbi:MAG: hypothetical protein O3A87_07960 [Verrucomicrobia bacterium]|nr:hypothetical protein [Verrucomicrobiota bacterium]
MRAKIFVPLLVLVVAVMAIGINGARQAQGGEPEAIQELGTWYKGNTHTHSLWSDGNDFPEMIVGWYKERGYDFLALSDHNVLSRGERWMPVAQVEQRRKVGKMGSMEKYLAAFGEEWVERREEAGKEEVRLRPLEEFRPKFEEEGEFLLIEAEEITDRFQNHQVHINALNLGEVIPPQHGESVVDTMRKNLRMVAEQSERLGRPMLAHVNHPNFHWPITPQELAEVVEDQFFEVYNGHPAVNHQGDAERPGDEEIWDIANTLRLMLYDAPPLFGVATDDSHQYHGGDASPGRGWVMVRAEKLEAGALVEAMERGEFYASTGVVLKEVEFDRKTRTQRVEIEAVEGVSYEIKFVGTRKGTPEKAGEVLATVSGSAAEYQMKGDELYVRVVVNSSRPHPNPSYKEQWEQAWTQPVGWRK